jgi:4-amino-4-deoxy-L-arabinose transferase-like glycosyltransferase
MKNIRILILAAILILAGALRFYKLDQVPPSLNWDEAAAGYNAYTIANWGADEYGDKFQIVFKSFGDDKHPVHIYLTALVVKVFGLSDFSTRASSAAIGVLMVLAIYILGRELFKSEVAGLFSALFLAVSPYALHYSRGLWEANFALFFLIAGCATFLTGLNKHSWLVPISFVFWGLSFFSYHSAKVVVPPVVFLLCAIHIKDLIKNKKILIWSILAISLFISLVIKEPKILGFARINQNKFSEEILTKYGGQLGTVLHNYKGYFNYSYLFQKGDQSPRTSVKVIGEFYKIDLILFLIGLVAIVLRKKWGVLILLVSWLALAPIPGAVSSTDPSAVRGIFMIGPVILLSASGASVLTLLTKKYWIRIGTAAIIIIFLALEVNHYLNYYFTVYPKKEAIEWQYGMRQIVDYLKENPNYAQVFMDKVRQQPYIFYLYYFKTPLPQLLATVRYDESESKSFNTVFSFNNYQFGGWDIIESYPNQKVLYVMTPSFYTGLRFINNFEVKSLIKYPDGGNAFYIVGAPLK